MNPLNIPLTDNPTRQKIWRVVVFVAPLLLATGLSILVVRTYLALDTISSFVPNDAEMTVRIIKTPKTSAVLENKFHGTVLFQNAPFTLDELGRWSKRGSAIFINETGVVGVAVAGKIPQAKLNEAKAFNLVVVQRFGGTYIGTVAPGSTKFSFRLPVKSLLPWFNGEINSAEDQLSAPIRLTEHSLTISGLGRSGDINNTNSDQSLAKMTVTAAEAQNLLGFDVPLVYPGLRALEEQMITHGFVVSLGQDIEGTPYSVTVPEGNLTKEDMESTVNELYYTKSLVLLSSGDVYTSLDEIISTSSAQPITTSDPSATITSITDNSGTIVRAAQTAHGLVLTNRQVNLDGSTTTGSAKNVCLPRANQWVSIGGLTDLLPARLSTPGWTFIQNLLNSQEIAFSNHRTRICW
ncbi:MAG: hypothetical protein WC813_04660 [Patescibacteria group bacterium]|jgi:hypothetical protein